MSGWRWSWADVQGLDALRRPPNPRGPGGRRKHPITLGHHDHVIVPMALRGARVVDIASALDCRMGMVERRLRALSREEKAVRIKTWGEQNTVAPQHPITAGAHDGVLIAMAQQGARVVAIAARLECSADVVAERLRVLGEAVRV